jgi:dethiobiotin synthetase
MGWIANDVDPSFQRRAGNLDTLERLLGSPPLAVAPWTAERSFFGNARLELNGAARLRQALLATAGV